MNIAMSVITRLHTDGKYIKNSKGEIIILRGNIQYERLIWKTHFEVRA